MDSEENIKIIAYSLRKISTNPTEPYSMLNPDTSSDSPSEKSKGVRLVSATAIINHKTISNIIRKKNFPEAVVPPILNEDNMYIITIINNAILIS